MQLHLYDFDGTLFRSPDEPAAHAGDDAWVMSHESLGPPCVPEVPGPEWWNPEVVAAAEASINDPDVTAVVCTGRAEEVFWPRIRQLLQDKGLAFDRVLCNNLGYAGSTRRFKLEALREMLYANPRITDVQIWEDDAEGLAVYKLSVQRLGFPCTSHLVAGSPANAAC